MEKGPKIAFQVLFYPSVNISAIATDSAKCFSKGYVLTDRAMTVFRSFYLPNKADWENPYASPLKATDFTNLPPALVTTAGCDPLLSEGEAYSQQLQQAGVQVTYHLEPNIFHGYLGLLNKDPIVSPIAEKTLNFAVTEIRNHLK
jgi:acetyl esterase